MKFEKLTLVEHLEELRKRLIICLFAILLGSIFSYLYIDKILAFISAPVGKLIFLKPTELLLTRIKVSFYSGVFFSLPVIIYQAWKFISPGLVGQERRYFYWVVPFSYLLFACGLSFAFLGVLPLGIKFLLNYSSENIQPMISVGSYISFVVTFLLAFGIIFQLPLVILFLTKIGIITPQWLVKNRKYAILVIFILAGVLTPGPDIVSQFLMAVPTLILYEVGIQVSKLVKSQNKN